MRVKIKRGQITFALRLGHCQIAEVSRECLPRARIDTEPPRQMRGQIRHTDHVQPRARLRDLVGIALVFEPCAELGAHPRLEVAIEHGLRDQSRRAVHSTPQRLCVANWATRRAGAKTRHDPAPESLRHLF